MPDLISAAECDPEVALETLRRLARFGFGDAEFELVHHWGADAKLNVFTNHCVKLIQRKQRFRANDNNHFLHLRLTLVLDRCGGFTARIRDWKPLAEEALKRYPPIDKK